MPVDYTFYQFRLKWGYRGGYAWRGALSQVNLQHQIVFSEHDKLSLLAEKRAKWDFHWLFERTRFWHAYLKKTNIYPRTWHHDLDPLLTLYFSVINWHRGYVRHPQQLSQSLFRTPIEHPIQICSVLRINLNYLRSGPDINHRCENISYFPRLNCLTYV